MAKKPDKKNKTYNFARFYWLVILIPVVFVYGRTIYFGYTHLDDEVFLLDNKQNVIGLENIPAAFSQTLFVAGNFDDVYYRPIFNSVLILIATISGVDSLWLFHLTKLLFHFLACIFLYKLLLSFNISESVSLFLTLLFAVHPVFSMAVAWVPGMNDSLTGVLLFSCMYYISGYFKSGEKRDLYLSIVIFTFLIFTKELAVSVLPVVLIYYFLFGKQSSNRKKLILIFTSLAAVSLVFFFIRSSVVTSSDILKITNLTDALVSNIPFLIQLPGKLIYPFAVTVLPMVKDTSVIPGLIFFGLMIYFIHRNKERNNSLIIFGLCWYLLFMLPGLIVNPEGFNQDHRLYAAFPGLALLMSQMNFLKPAKMNLPLVRLVCIGVIILFGVYTFKYISVFADRMNFWTEAVNSSPNSVLANSGMGSYYISVNDLTNAEKYLVRANEISPNEKFINNNLGYVYIERGELERAEIFVNKEIEFNPTNSKAYLNLALINLKRENYPKAEELLLQTLKMNPFDTQALRYMSAMYFRLGDKQKSREYALKLLELGESLPPDMKRDLEIQ